MMPPPDNHRHTLTRSTGSSLSRSFLAALMLTALPGLQADQVIPDDLIVQGSLAVGIDAVNNESFGFDTIRLKGPDLRIHFDDTSALAGFPANDWRILINDLDSAASADNYFAVEDATAGTVPFRIDAGAPNHSLHLGGDGRIGLLTNIPAASFHVNLTFEETDATRSVLIGPDTVTPAGALLQVHGPVYLSREGGGELTIDPLSETRFYVEGGAVFSRNVEVGSSRDLKEDIRELTAAEAREALLDLQAVEYRYLGDPETQLGFIAEDVPDLVATEGRRSLSPMDFVALLTKVVQDQESRMQAQDAEFSELRETVRSLLDGPPAPGNQVQP